MCIRDRDIHYILRSNGLECRSIGLPIPNNPMLINPVRNTNEEASHGANIHSKLNENNCFSKKEQLAYYNKYDQ